MINTQYGYKNLSDLCVGDKVLNNIFSLDTILKKELFFVKSNYILKLCLGNTISLSSNKMIYVSKRVSYNKNDSYGISYPYGYFTKPFWIPVSELTSEYLLCSKISKNIKLPDCTKKSKRFSLLMKQPAFWFLLGIYLDTGYIEINNRSVLYLTFPRNYLSLVLTQVEDLCFTYVVENYKMLTKIKIFDTDFICLINQMSLGNSVETKQIPVILYELPLMQLHFLFQGFQLTNGKFQNNKIILRHSNQSLILGLSQLLLKFRYSYELNILNDLHGNKVYQLIYELNDVKNNSIYFSGLNVYYSIKEIIKENNIIQIPKLISDTGNGYLLDNVIVKDTEMKE